ncbi:hypothetical protein Tco_1464955 [Tanacetum coccineum]
MLRDMTGNKDHWVDFKRMQRGIMLPLGGSKGLHLLFKGQGKRVGTSEVNSSAGTLQTPNANASEEEDEAEELIIVPIVVNNTQHANQDDLDMPELTIFNKTQKGIFDEASYDDEGEYLKIFLESLKIDSWVKAMQEELYGLGCCNRAHLWATIPETQPLSPRQETAVPQSQDPTHPYVPEARTVTVEDLLHLVPNLITKIDIKKLEDILKRRHVVLTDSEDEEPEDQGRIIQDINNDPLVSKGDFVTPTKPSGEAQEEEINPTTLEAAKKKTLSKVASQKIKSVDKGVDKECVGKELPEGRLSQKLETDEKKSVASYGILLLGYKIPNIRQIWKDFQQAMLKDFIREDLIELYRLVMQKYGTNRPEDVYDRVL